jgi:hypothetical protein
VKTSGNVSAALVGFMIVAITYYRGCELRLEKRNNSFHVVIVDKSKMLLAATAEFLDGPSAVNEAKMIVNATLDLKR